MAEKRVRAWVAYMVLAGLLERVAARDGGYRFTIKGGVALELRLLDRARATKDIDLVLHHTAADLAEALENAITPPAAGQDAARTRDGSSSGQGRAEEGSYQHFRFRRKGEPLALENGTMNLELAVSYRGGTWTTISVDIARAEPGEAEVELLKAVDFESDLGIAGPDRVPCLPLRFHVAQKIHGMTLPPRPGKRNERFRDLIDLMLMEAMITDYAGLREACEQVFASRMKHGWPPPLELPDHWREPYARLAVELHLPVTDADEAMDRVRALVERIRRTP